MYLRVVELTGQAPIINVLIRELEPKLLLTPQILALAQSKNDRYLPRLFPFISANNSIHKFNFFVILQKRDD